MGRPTFLLNRHQATRPPRGTTQNTYDSGNGLYVQEPSPRSCSWLPAEREVDVIPSSPQQLPPLPPPPSRFSQPRPGLIGAHARSLSQPPFPPSRLRLHPSPTLTPHPCEGRPRAWPPGLEAQVPTLSLEAVPGSTFNLRLPLKACTPKQKPPTTEIPHFSVWF